MPDFVVPPTGSADPTDPEYQEFAHQARVYLDGQLATADTVGVYVIRYNIPEGWIEGRPRTPDGRPDFDALTRLHGVVRVELAD
jgi:hypothetical protein